MVEMIVGSLPWRHGDRAETYEMKRSTPDDKLFKSKCPDEMRISHKYGVLYKRIHANQVPVQSALRRTARLRSGRRGIARGDGATID